MRLAGLVDRRAMLGAVVPTSFALCASLDGASASAAPADANTETWLRLVADPGGRTTVSLMEGLVWGFKPQADDLALDDFAKPLYGYRSLLARKLGRNAQGARTLTTKGWTFYLDPVTRAEVDHVHNPYTGLEVACPPLSGPAFTAVYDNAKPSAPLDLTAKRIGEHAFVTIARLSRFKPADTTWFKLEADLTSYACKALDLDHPTGFIPSTWSHNLVAEWQTWMNMHGAPGHILFKGDGALLPTLDAAPKTLLAAIERAFPKTLSTVQAWS